MAGPPVIVDPEWLRREYCVRKRPLSNIARQLRCHPDTVKIRLLEFNVPIRPKPPCFHGKLTREFLTDAYVAKKLSLAKIARLVGCGEVTVHKRIRTFGIRREKAALPLPPQVDDKLRPRWHRKLRAELAEFRRVRDLVHARVGHVPRVEPQEPEMHCVDSVAEARTRSIVFHRERCQFLPSP
jgi:hypothetical protein